MKARLRGCVWLAIGALSLVLPDVVEAQRARVVVEEFDGPHADMVRTHLLKGLRQSRVRIVTPTQLDRAARRLGRDLTSAEDYHSVARALDVDGFIYGEVFRRRGWQAEVSVRGSDGEMREPVTVRGRSPQALASVIRRRVPRELDDTLDSPPLEEEDDEYYDEEEEEDARPARSARSRDRDRYSDRDRDRDRDRDSARARDRDRVHSRRSGGREPAARVGHDEDYEDEEYLDEEADEDDEDYAEEDEDEEEYAEEDEEEDYDDDFVDDERPPGVALDDEEEDFDGPSFRSEHSALDFQLGTTFINRKFDYRNDTVGLPPYRMPFGPAVLVGGTWYPAALFRNDALAGLGLRFDFSRSFLLRSSGPDGARYETAQLTWSIAPRYRFEAGPVRLTGDIAIAHHGFAVEARNGEPEPQLASVGYTGLRPEVAVRVRLPENVRLDISAAYFFLFNTGEIGSQEHFPGEDARGFAVGAGVAYVLPHGFELFGNIEANIYLHNFNSETTAGAVDRYFFFNVGAGWALEPDREAD